MGKTSADGLIKTSKRATSKDDNRMRKHKYAIYYELFPTQDNYLLSCV